MRALAVAALLLLSPALGVAQLPPNADWRTLRTEHFAVHFTSELDTLARHAAAAAERAWEWLATELAPPRGPVELVIADNVDFSNGYATPFPSNRIVVYAHPPTDGQSLRFYENWLELVILHELTHVFHLDRTRGWWRLAQRLVGRNPLTFPNLYTPAWLTEGLAVYYESRFTQAGRLLGSEHRMIARAAAIEGMTPRLDELSLATPRFPGGQSAYAYGSLLLDYIARTRGAPRIPALVEHLSADPIPFLLNHAARDALGISFSRAWREWRDSLALAVAAPGEPVPGWRALSRDGWFALHPRWLGDSTLVYAASTGRETPGAYTVGLSHGPERRSRRNSLGPQDPIDDGALLFAQLEFVSPYHVRSDLYIERDGATRRLTDGARLSHPDARRTGEIVAVAAVPGSTRLVLLDAEGRHQRWLTSASADTQWTEPRWSPAGDRIAAVRWTRGGWTEIVVLDAEGGAPRLLARSRGVNASPSWTPGGDTVLFASDRSGAMNLYAVAAAPALSGAWNGDVAAPLRVSNAATGMMEPERAPDGAHLAAVLYRATGHYLGAAPAAMLQATPDTAIGVPAGEGDRTPPPAVTARASRYSPWRSLRPRYWMPSFITDGDATLLGGFASGADVIRRHSWSARGLLGTDADSYLAEGSWRYAGFGQPLIDVGATRWRHPELVITTDGGVFRETETGAAVAATFVRPRFRTSASMQLGVEADRFLYEVAPAALRDSFDIPEVIDRLGVFASAGWTNAQRPALSISPEDGIAISTTVRQRWYPGEGTDPTRSAIGAVSAYRSLPLPGYAHHVLAVRLAGGWTDDRATSALEAGGVSGAPAQLGLGFAIGASRRTFAVRGFPAAARRGTRAAAGSVEYRAPLALPARGLGLFPAFLGKTALTVFGDVGTAWCPERIATRFVCTVGAPGREWLASTGAELVVDAAVLNYDQVYRFRGGIAAPVANKHRANAESPVVLYFSAGLSF